MGQTSQPATNGISVDLPNNTVLARLDRVDALIEAQQWQDAVETIRSAMEDGNESVILVGPERPDGFRRYLSLRDYCQMRLARLAHLAPDAFDYYRSLVDARAERAWQAASQSPDTTALLDVVDRFFASSSGDDALLRLGDLEVERGNWTAARRHYEQLHAQMRFWSRGDESPYVDGWPTWLLTRQFRAEDQWHMALQRFAEPTSHSTWPVYPNTSIDPAVIASRLVLVSILARDVTRAQVELELIRRHSPEARGLLAGRDGNFVTTLEALLDKSKSWPSARLSEDWPTFGGGPDRRHVIPANFQMAQTPRWQRPLLRRSALGSRVAQVEQRVGEPVDALLGYHAVVVGDRVIVQTGNEQDVIVCYGLTDGDLIFGREDTTTIDAEEPDVSDHSPVELPKTFSLSASESRVFARLDSTIDEAIASRLVAFDIQRQGKLTFDRSLDGPAWDGDWRFGSAPLLADGRVFVTVRRTDPVGTAIHVACFDETDGELIWRRKVCGGTAVQFLSSAATPHTLLSFSEDTIYCNTHLGAIAAMRAHDGRVRWITEYPRAENDISNPDRNVQHAFRNMTPCLIYRGLVIAAPADCNRLFALDANSGHVIWTTRPERATDVIHLLGVGAGNLIAGGDYLYWLDVYTGDVVNQFPPPRKTTPGHAKPTPRGHGRGVLAGNNVYWPTRKSIFVFKQRTVRTELSSEPPLVREIDLTSRGATGGNLTVAQNVLVIVAADQLYVFDRHGHTSDSDNQ